MPGFNIKTTGNCGGDTGCSTGYTGPNPLVETARKHRYRLQVLDPVKDILLYAYKCQRPTSEADIITMHHGQEEIKKPGKTRWLPVEIAFYEVVDKIDRTAQYLSRWWGNCDDGSSLMYDPALSVLAPDPGFKRKCVLELEDGCGLPVWLYYLYDVWPSKVTPSELSYADTEIAEIACTLEIGKAIEGGN